MENNPDQYYIGPTAILVEYHRRYYEEELPPVRMNGQVLKDLKLSTPRKTGRNKGVAKYLCYPEWTIYEKLGERVLEADFVGEKFITGHSATYFLRYTFKKKARLRHSIWVEGETTDEFIRCSTWFSNSLRNPE